MSKPGTLPEVSATDLENVAKDLGLNKLYDEFYVKKTSSKYFQECDALNEYDKTHTGVKELCIKLISSLEKLAEMKTKNKDYNDRCNYLPHWLFDEIGKIYKPIPSKNSNNIPFFSKLSHIGNTVNMKLTGNRCTTLPYSNSISLDARKNRKNSYIYLKKYEEIKQIINAKESSRGGSTSSGSWLSSWFGSSTGSSRSGKDSSPPETAKAGGKEVDKGVKGTPKSPGGARDSTGSVSKVTASGTGDKFLTREASPGHASTLVTKIPLSPTPGKSPGTLVNTIPSYSTDIKTDTVAVPIADSSGNLGTVNEKLDSSFYHNIIMAAAILGTIFFLFYYNMSSGLKSRFPKRKRKKKIFEHNYYEEYEKELAKYDSEDMSLVFEEDRYYLNYQPEHDYDY
ncbi:unnamed protein product [Plasmodium vivax]|uniref:(malaria parasite P. vivax) hypothetical protein n=1 Tax=Plasmodium vivax TaxID=5855 RepID=A0A8S4HAW4_PLAVI|nr:unnamed protein product [Plasmodium vivax]